MDFCPSVCLVTVEWGVMGILRIFVIISSILIPVVGIMVRILVLMVEPIVVRMAAVTQILEALITIGWILRRIWRLVLI